MATADITRRGASGRPTQEVGGSLSNLVLLPRFRLEVMHPRKGESLQWDAAGDRCSIGSDPGNDLIVAEPTVSRYHCEVWIESHGASVRDLGSLNGTIVDGVRVKEATLKAGSILKLGEAQVQFHLGDDTVRITIPEHTRFGSIVGESTAMRSLISMLERAAATDATVLLEGETGTGKGATAESIHRASARKAGPFIVVDCGAIPENLLESELFGHEKGSFTGAGARRVGAFEEAAGGTIFLDEIGELPPGLQPKLLRAVETHEIRRVGSNAHMPVDVRVIAATNRDLRADANQGRFRSDLYFRLAVIKVTLPPLRQRRDDVQPLARALLAGLHASHDQIDALLTPAFVEMLERAEWPGNVRELRNYLERCMVFQEPQPIGDAPPEGAVVESELTYADARRRALDEFERRYAEAVLRKHDGKVAKAAEAAGIARVHLYRLLRRHSVK